jgi:hypothetical protein
MRLLGILAAVAALGLAAGVALGGTVPIPGITTVSTSLSVPTLPTTTVRVTLSTPTTTVRVTASTPTTTVRVPTTTVRVPTTTLSKTTTTTSGSGGGSGPVSTVTTAVNNAVGSATGTGTGSSGSSGSSGSGAGSSGGGGSASSGSSPSAGSAGGGSPGASSGSAGGSAPAAQPQHFQSSRTFISISGPKKRRTTTLTFVLPRRARVLLTVTQVAPVCRAIGHLTVRGRPGLNRVRFNGRVHRRRLQPGTYWISLRTANGMLVRRIVLVVTAGAPSPAEVRAARATNVCSAAAAFKAFAFGTGSGPVSGGGAATISGAGQQPQTGGISAPRGSNLHSGVLGSTVEKTARAIRWFLVALLAVAIVLLATASLPRAAVPDARVNDLLARHRIELAGLGAVALAAVAVAFLL